MKQKPSPGGRVQKGLYVRAGENADLLFSLAVTSATSPDLPLPWQLTAPSHIALCLCWVESGCTRSTPRTCKQLQMQNTALHTQGVAPAELIWGCICSGAGLGAIPSCLPPQNNEAGTFCYSTRCSPEPRGPEGAVGPVRHYRTVEGHMRPAGSLYWASTVSPCIAVPPGSPRRWSAAHTTSKCHGLPREMPRNTPVRTAGVKTFLLPSTSKSEKLKITKLSP